MHPADIDRRPVPKSGRSTVIVAVGDFSLLPGLGGLASGHFATASEVRSGDYAHALGAASGAGPATTERR